MPAQVFRGIPVKFQVEHYLPGSHVVWPSFSSTSEDYKVAEQFLAGERAGGPSNAVGKQVQAEEMACFTPKEILVFQQIISFLFLLSLFALTPHPCLSIGGRLRATGDRIFFFF